jgi:hypothetical protein
MFPFQSERNPSCGGETRKEKVAGVLDQGREMRRRKASKRHDLGGNCGKSMPSVATPLSISSGPTT